MTSILTGDIVNSRSVSNHDVWMIPLKEVLQRYGQEPKEWEIYRGDQFQLEIGDVRESLLVAILLKATVRIVPKLDVRIAIGIGDANYRAAKISQSNGEAFIRSGEMFEEMKKTTLAVRSPWSGFDGEANLFLELGAWIMSTWSTSSAEVVKASIENPNATQTMLAAKFGISQGRVSERLKRAGFEEIMKLENWFRSTVSKKMTKTGP